MSGTMRCILAALLCGPFFALGCWLLASAARHIRLRVLACTWPTAIGIVRKAELTGHEDADGNTYGLQLEYVFEVEGESHVGTRIFPGSDRYQRAMAGGIANRYREDGRVTVYYDPENPGRCFLEIDHWNRSIGLALGCGLFAMGLSSILWLALVSPI